MKIIRNTTSRALVALAASIGLFACAGTGAQQEPAPPAAEAATPQAPRNLYDGSPYLGELRNSLVYGEIWERPQLSKRDRSLITVAVLQALVRDELELHIPRGLDNGLTPEEISEIILHVTFYAGWPTGVQASLTAASVFEERGLSLGPLAQAPTVTNQPDAPAAASGAYAAVPRLGELRNSLLYGDIWERPQLSKRDRSLVTVAVTQALYATSELRTHIGRALDENGVTPQEISEVILHLTFYAGWPKAVNAGRLAAEAFEARGVSFADIE
jgi:4-carboxymuconolactone decarboxylase